MSIVMSMRRSRLELHADILETIQGGINKPTRIMYNRGIDWTSLTQLLQSLMDQGFVDVSFHDEANKKGRKIYSVTEKGAVFLSNFNKARDLMWSKVSSALVNV
ncbi:hypothetical protein A3K78_06235 [Candidatus Bathyarchaeota archaeon RBG_13_52_12]|nr:MAG: hypothetical protein A3K78_06235 [Candidatus Bathyarchaeota archaeon RBG_13_52_12]